MKQWCWIVLAACLGMSPSVLLAQQPTGAITGLITDPSGASIPQAIVTITSPATGFRVELRTTAAGAYTAASLLPGDYEVRIEAPGFKSVVLKVKVEVGRVALGDARLEVGDVAQTVKVEAHASRVNPTQTTLEGIVTDTLIRDLPLNGRNFLDLGQLEPGAQLINESVLIPLKGAYTSLSLAGQSGQSTRITIDGLDVGDEIVGSNVLNISQDAIQEYQVSRSSLDISTGLSGTGAVNIVTASGSNEVHGSAFFFWRDDAGTARLGQQRSPFDREQIGFSVGGPFLRDKLFWFVNYERNNQDGAVATNVGGFPQLSGTWPVPFDERMATARLDWNITRNLRSFFRFSHNFNEGVQTGRLGIGGVLLSPFASKNNANQTAAGFDFSVGRFTQMFRYGHLKASNFEEDATGRYPDLPLVTGSDGRAVLLSFLPLGCAFRIECPPAVGPSSLSPLRLLQGNDEFRYDGSYSLGRHTLRWGSLVNRIRINWFASFWGRAPEIDIAFNDANQQNCRDDLLCYPVTSAVIANGLGFLTEVPTLGLPLGGAKNTRVHWYLGDSWRAAPRLTINYGVRYVYEPGVVSSDLEKPALLDDFLPGLSHRDRRDKNNFAPHLGLAWDPTGNGKWVLRAGAGIFFDVRFLNAVVFSRAVFLPPGISWTLAFPPFLPVIDPVTGQTIFDMTGSDLTAPVTPGVNWIGRPLGFSGIPGPPPGGTFGMSLIDAVLLAWDKFRAASLVAAANFPSGPTIFEIMRSDATFLPYLPNYQTPYTLQLNVGVQRELRPGLVLSVDYVRHRGLHYPMVRNLNRVGATDTLDVARALAAMDGLHSALGCPLGPPGVACAITAGAGIEDYAANGLGRGQAFPGMNTNFLDMQFNGMQGRSTYNALQVTLRERLPDLGRAVKNWTLAGSYSLSRLEASVGDQFSSDSEFPINNDDLFAFSGPTTFDRTHMLSIGSLFEIPGGVRVNSIWRFFTALPQSVFVPQVSGSAAEIFYTDFNGDGTVGDPLPGTSRGSYGRDIGCGAAALNRVIDPYNAGQAGRLTPAGQALVDAGLFTTTQLQSLGATSPSVPRSPAGEVCLDSFATTDIRISRPFKLWRERITVEPSWEWFNLFNVANYDLPGNKLSGQLTGAPGSINGTTRTNRPNRAGFGSGSFSPGVPRSWQFALRVSF